MLLTSCHFYDDKFDEEPFFIRSSKVPIEGIVEFSFSQNSVDFPTSGITNEVTVINISSRQIDSVAYLIEVYENQPSSRTLAFQFESYEVMVAVGDSTTEKVLNNFYQGDYDESNVQIDILHLDYDDSITTVEAKNLVQSNEVTVDYRREANTNSLGDIQFISHQIVISNNSSFDYNPFVFHLRVFNTSNLISNRAFDFLGSIGSINALSTSDTITINPTFEGTLNSSSVEFRILNTGTNDHPLSGIYVGDYTIRYADGLETSNQVELVVDKDGEMQLYVQNFNDFDIISGFLTNDGSFKGEIIQSSGVQLSDSIVSNSLALTSTELSGSFRIGRVPTLDSLIITATKLSIPQLP